MRMNKLIRKLFLKTDEPANKLPTKGTPSSLRNRRLSLPEQSFPILNYGEEQQARKALELVEDYTMTSYERMMTLWNQVRYLDRAGIPGALVECGTWRGGACGMMALAHRTSGNPGRQIHLFDSFEGLPEPDSNVDGERAINYAAGHASGNLASIERCIGLLEDNQSLMQKIVQYPEDLTAYHVGWFENTVPEARKSLGPIALLRLDGDWYASTKVCLENLFSLVPTGGMVVIDDYGHWEGCRKAVDEFLSSLRQPMFLNYVDKTARYVIVP